MHLVGWLLSHPPSFTYLTFRVIHWYFNKIVNSDFLPSLPLLIAPVCTALKIWKSVILAPKVLVLDSLVDGSSWKVRPTFQWDIELSSIMLVSIYLLCLIRIITCLKTDCLSKRGNLTDNKEGTGTLHVQFPFSLSISTFVPKINIWNRKCLFSLSLVCVIKWTVLAACLNYAAVNKCAFFIHRFPFTTVVCLVIFGVQSAHALSVSGSFLRVAAL